MSMRILNRFDLRRVTLATETHGSTRYQQHMHRRERQELQNTLDTDCRRNGLLSSLCRDQVYPPHGIEELLDEMGV